MPSNETPIELLLDRHLRILHQLRELLSLVPDLLSHLV
jgi:hypothetical protein